MDEFSVDRNAPVEVSVGLLSGRATGLNMTNSGPQKITIMLASSLKDLINEMLLKGGVISYLCSTWCLDSSAREGLINSAMYGRENDADNSHQLIYNQTMQHPKLL